MVISPNKTHNNVCLSKRANTCVTAMCGVIIKYHVSMHVQSSGIVCLDFENVDLDVYVSCAGTSEL